jgi:hypothetical protein
MRLKKLAQIFAQVGHCRKICDSLLMDPLEYLRGTKRLLPSFNKESLEFLSGKTQEVYLV